MNDTLKLYESVLDAMPDSIVGINERKEIVFFNTQAEKLFGYTKENVMRKKLDALIPERFRKIHESLTEHYLGNSTVISSADFSREQFGVNKKGEEFPIETSLSYLQIGAETIALSCIRDVSGRKEREQHLQAEEQRYHSLFDQASDAIMITDFSGNFMDVNPSLCSMFGYEREELLTMNVEALIDPEQLRVRPLNFEALAEGQHIFSERRMMCKEGIVIEVEANVKKISQQRVMAIARDVTALHNAQRKIELSEATFRGAFESAAIGMAMVSIEGRYMKVNPRLCSMLGYSEEEFLQLNFRRITNPGDESTAEAEKYIQNVLSGGAQEFQIEKRYVHKNGSLVWVHLTSTLVRDGNHQPQYFIAQILDISARKNVEQSLRKSKRQLDEAQRIAHIGSWTLDPLSREFECSEEVFRIFEIDKSTFDNTTDQLRSVIPDEDIADMDKAFVESWDNKSFFHHTHRVKLPDGRIKWIHQQGEYYFDEKGDRMLSLGTMQDITEQTSQEKEREKLLADLTRHNQDLEQFAYIISHNLRAPVTNIMGFTNELMEPNVDADHSRHIVDRLNTSVYKLDSVIKDLNDILSHKRQVQELRQEVTLQKLLNDISLVMEKVITEQQVQIISDFSEVGEIYARKSYLHSIFQNLISNSIKYRNAKVSPVIEIRSRLEKGNVVLFFRDNGIGIDLKKHGDKVFGLYKRFHHKIEGKGMGLFMVKTQVESMGGTISLTSEVGKGSEFRIEFGVGSTMSKGQTESTTVQTI